MKMKRLLVMAILFCLISFGAMLVTPEGPAAGNCTTCSTEEHCISVSIGFNACGSIQINRQRDCNVSGGTCGL